MHEFSIIQNLFNIIKKKAKEFGLVSVSTVHLKVGKLRQLVPEFLQMVFEVATKDSIAEGAKLIIEIVPIKMHCESCQQDFVVEQNEYVCPVCAGIELTLLSGKEIIIEEIEGEINDAN